MTASRFEPAMATLADGRVLISGGLPNQESDEGLASAEIYDPASNAFSPTGAMAAPRIEHAMTLLDDGSVLVSGGYSVSPGTSVPEESLQRYDPASGTFASAGAALDRGRPPHIAPIRLADGRVLMIFADPTMRCGRHGVDRYVPASSSTRHGQGHPGAGAPAHREHRDPTGRRPRPGQRPLAGDARRLRRQ